MKIVIFASGNGTNAQNLFHFAQESSIEVKALVCDQPDAPVIEKAKKHQVETAIIPFEKKGNKKQSKKDQEKKILELLADIDFDWICLAGYMRVLSNNFIKEFFDERLGISRIINIHPSLLPSFKGKNSYKDAYDYGVKVSGVTLHLVEGVVDSGSVLMQQSFIRKDNDSFEIFKKRGMEVEYKLYRDLLIKLSRFEPYMKNDPKLIYWRERCV